MTFEIPNTITIEPGTYKAQLMGVSVKTGGSFKTPQNPDGSYRVWDWAVEVEAGKDLTPLSVTTSLNTGARSTSFAWLTVLLGRVPRAGEKLESPTGKTVLLTIGKKDNGFPKVELVSPFVEPQQTLPGVPR